jgi:hypothetical protein
MDLIKLGFALGLFRNKTELRNGKTSILLDLLLGQTKNIDYSCVSSRFKTYPHHIKESEKIHIINQHNFTKTEQYNQLTTHIIKEELKKINKFVYTTMEREDSKLFITICIETTDAILDDTLNEDDDELLCVLRSALFLFLSFRNYKKIFKKQWKKNPNMVYKNTIDNIIINHQCVVSKVEQKQMLQSLIIKEFNTDLPLKCYNFKEIYRECCTPILLYLPLKAILYYNIARLNSIGFLRITDDDHWSFYVLKEITNDIRVWIIDNTLHFFSVNLTKVLLSYIVYLFRRYYFCCFQTTQFTSECWNIKINNNAKTFINMFKNILFLTDYIKFNNFLTHTIKTKSVIIPTEYDVFDCFTYFSETVKITNAKIMFSQVVLHIFENTINEDDIDQLFIFINQLTCE